MSFDYDLVIIGDSQSRGTKSEALSCCCMIFTRGLSLSKPHFVFICVNSGHSNTPENKGRQILQDPSHAQDTPGLTFFICPMGVKSQEAYTEYSQREDWGKTHGDSCPTSWATCGLNKVLCKMSPKGRDEMIMNFRDLPQFQEILGSKESKGQ